MSTVANGLNDNHLSPGGGDGDHPAGAVDITSIHSHISDELTDEEREAAEEAERLKEPFRIFDKESYKRLEKREHERKVRVENNEEEEARLVDGEIVFDEDGTAKQDKDPKLADGQTLPEKMGRFPKELLGVPLEEIDPYIKVKVTYYLYFIYYCNQSHIKRDLFPCAAL